MPLKLPIFKLPRMVKKLIVVLIICWVICLNGCLTISVPVSDEGAVWGYVVITLGDDKYTDTIKVRSKLDRQLSKKKLKSHPPRPQKYDGQTQLSLGSTQIDSKLNSIYEPSGLNRISSGINLTRRVHNIYFGNIGLIELLRPGNNAEIVTSILKDLTYSPESNEINGSIFLVPSKGIIIPNGNPESALRSLSINCYSPSTFPPNFVIRNRDKFLDRDEIIWLSLENKLEGITENIQ